MEKKLAIITGTSRGIGRAMQKALIQENIPTISINRTALSPVHETLHTNLEFDLQALNRIDKLAEQMLDLVDIEKTGHIFLINNAAITGVPGPLSGADHSSLQSTIEINLLSPMLLSSSLINAFEPFKKSMDIINISSGAAFSPIEGLGPYCISKAGLEMLSKTLNLENEQKGIRSITIGPGVVDTGMQTTLRSSNPEKFRAHNLFSDFKAKGLLQSADQVANKIIAFVLNREFEGGRYYGISELS